MEMNETNHTNSQTITVSKQISNHLVLRLKNCHSHQYIDTFFDALNNIMDEWIKNNAQKLHELAAKSEKPTLTLKYILLKVISKKCEKLVSELGTQMEIEDLKCAETFLGSDFDEIDLEKEWKEQGSVVMQVGEVFYRTIGSQSQYFFDGWGWISCNKPQPSKPSKCKYCWQDEKGKFRCNSSAGELYWVPKLSLSFAYGWEKE